MAWVEIRIGRSGLGLVRLRHCRPEERCESGGREGRNNFQSKYFKNAVARRTLVWLFLNLSLYSLWTFFMTLSNIIYNYRFV